MKSGISPRLVVEQVKNTASWLWQDARAHAVVATLDDVDAAEESRSGVRVENAAEAACEGLRDGVPYLRLLLAAHFATVATFVPTDVDARVRHHAWMAIDDVDELARACDAVDEVATWDARWVSERTLPVPEIVEDESISGSISGHDGEWLGVRAGALGRAAALGAHDVVERLVEALDKELERQERVFLAAFDGDASVKRVLSAATILAHNAGDLSRVVEAWPASRELDALRPRYVRLGHPDGSAKRRGFVTAGLLNKALTALENHRFLALRNPRALRTSRSLLLPIGPWFGRWGETVARDPNLDERDRAQVVAALLEIHASSPEQMGCLRALAGMHRATRGGLELYVPNLPARLRKDALRGKVRDALDVPDEREEARLDRRYRIARAGAR